MNNISNEHFGVVLYLNNHGVCFKINRFTKKQKIFASARNRTRGPRVESGDSTIKPLIRRYVLLEQI